jgi:hypothetical protein
MADANVIKRDDKALAKIVREHYSKARRSSGKGWAVPVWIIRRGYFYTHGVTAESFADAVVKRLTAAGLSVELVNCGDHWHAWPKDSFFEAVIRVHFIENCACTICAQKGTANHVGNDTARAD